MKQRALCLFASLLLLLAAALPAAAADYGLIYDETNLLYTDRIEFLGTETLPAFLERYDIDLRVDILTSKGDFETLTDTAAYLYTEYEYGGSNGGNGASLTLLVEEDADGLTLLDWVAYFAGDSDEWTTNASWNINEVYNLLTPDALDGDIEQDAEVIADAIEAMVTGLDDFVQAGGVGGTIWSPHTEGNLPDGEQPGGDEPSQPVEPPVSGEEEEETLGSVTDTAGILSENEWQQLTRQADQLAETYGVGVYLVTVDNYRDLGSSINDAADALYHGFDLGIGEDRDAILLLLSMDDRNYNLIAYGDQAKAAFTTAGRERLDDFFLDDFGDNRWYDGFAEYLTWSGDFLEQAKNGTPYAGDHLPMTAEERSSAIRTRVAIILGVPLVVAVIYIFILTSKMKSVATAVEASAYLSGRLQLTRDYDHHTHTTETRRRIEKESSSSDSDGGGSGTSGRF
ncbi:MAG: TPM domain-containing protein [Clostridia bacterium]|nr:TPM domain-containing protein [Clostridia bacterium]